MRGGRPARDKRIKGARAVRAGAFAQEAARALIVVALFSLNTRNIEIVEIKYVRRAKMVRGGENCKIIIIQPRWAIEE